MSLLVWLPMTKDLSDQGLGGCTITNDGATLDNNGKLGKCYNFDGTNDRIQVSGLNNPKNITVAFWMKRNATTGTRQFLFTAWGGVSIELGAANNLFGKVSTSGGEAGGANGGTITADSGWIHVCYTFEDKVGGKMYINGVLTGSGATTSSIAWSTTSGYIGNYSNIYLNAKMNDFRIYDRALAPKEIEILSRGLVCHYPLCDVSNQTPNNVFTNSTFASSSGWNFWGQSGHSGTWNFTQNKDYIFNKTQTNACIISNGASATGDYLMYQSPAFSGGFRSLQAIIKEENSSAITDSIVYPVWNASASGSTPLNHWTSINDLGDGFYLCRCESIKQDGSNNLVGIYVKPGYKIYVSECYCENDRTVCSDFFYPSSTVYDTSGFKNNGETYAYDTTGSIECSSDTARYSLSTFINSANVTNNTTGIRYIYGNCELTTPQYLTVTFWCKPIAGYGGTGYANNGLFALTNNDIGTGAATDYNTAPMHHRDADIDMCTSTNVHRTLVFTPTANEWHHYAVVYDGRYGRAYKDGVQTATLDMGSNLSLSSFKAAVIGYSHAGGVYRKVRAYYSDFRIYATALSATQVAELYNTAVSVANNGTLMSYELVEV